MMTCEAGCKTTINTSEILLNYSNLNKTRQLDRRLRPLCCHLGGYSKHTLFSCRYIRMEITCKHDVIIFNMLIAA